VSWSLTWRNPRASQALRLLIPAFCLAVLTPATAQAAPASAAYPGAAGAGDPYFPRQGNGGYDVGHYDLTVRFTPASGRLDGTARITARATQALSRFNLDLRRNMRVSSVTVNGRAASFAQPEPQIQELVVTPAKPLARGRSFVVSVRYGGTPKSVTDPDGSPDGWITTSDGAFVASEPQGSPTWFPCNDTPTDKASFSVTATVPQGITAMGNGELVSQRTANGLSTFAWRSREPMSTYLSTITTGIFTVRTGTTSGGVPYLIAVDPTVAEASAAPIGKTPAIVDYFARVFGPYPFSTTGGIVDNAPQVGFALETQSRPIYDTAPDELTVAHELGHQWFGDAVTLTRWKDIWLNEGFAEFTSWLWSEHSGQGSAQSIFDDLYKTPASDAEFWTPPPSRPGGGAGIFSTSVYSRGAMTLQALRVKVGDPAFFRILRTWYADHRYGNATIEQFRATAQRISGQDLDHFFTVWLDKTAKPTDW
jgi:aminopeptidase N